MHTEAYKTDSWQYADCPCNRSHIQKSCAYNSDWLTEFLKFTATDIGKRRERPHSLEVVTAAIIFLTVSILGHRVTSGKRKASKACQQSMWKFSPR